MTLVHDYNIEIIMSCCRYIGGMAEIIHKSIICYASL